MVPELCEAAAPTAEPKNACGRGARLAAPASQPLLAVHGVSPHSRLYFQAPRNQFHCITEETSLNVKKPDN